MRCLTFPTPLKGVLFAWVLCFGVVGTTYAQSELTNPQKAYQRAYDKAQNRAEQEKITPIPEYKYHVETSLSLSGVLTLNDFAPTAEVPITYSKYVPELTTRFLFIKSGLACYGIEVSVAYGQQPEYKTTALVYQVGVARGVYKELGHRFLFGNHNGLGYISSIVDSELPKDLTSTSYGVYLSKRLSLIYQTEYNSAIGLSVGANAYYLWDWHYDPKPTPELPCERSGLGFYPTIGITYYFGGL